MSEEKKRPGGASEMAESAGHSPAGAPAAPASTQAKKRSGGARLVSGDFGYVDARKKGLLLKLILWVAVIGAVIVGGLLYYGTRMNAVTVVGVVLVLPAAKTLTGLILVGKYRTGSREEYEKISALAAGNSRVLADLVLTRYEGSMQVAIAVIHGGNIFAYVPRQKMAPEKIKEYLSVCVKAAGSEASPAVYTDFKKYYEFIKKMSASKSVPGKTEEKLASELLSRAV